jgi:hypothetical protein
MRKTENNLFIRILLSTILLILVSANAGAYEMTIQNDRISLFANDDSLTDIMKGFARLGVVVQMDPSLNRQVSGWVENEDLEKTLQELFDPYGYAFFWEEVSGPMGSFPKLTEIQIFEHGHKERMKPIEEFDPNLKVTRGPNVDGPLFVADEILLSVKPGTSIEEFRRLLAEIGGMVIDSIPDLGVYRVRLAPGTNVQALVDQLKNRDMIHSIEPNYVVESPQPIVAENSGDARESAVRSLMPAAAGAPALAILDSGLMNMPELDGAVQGKFDALDPTRALDDTAGHGTQMALVGAGAVIPEGGVAIDDGTATPLLAIRAFDDNGRASNFGLMRSVDYALENGAKVISLSWGSETSSDFLDTALKYAASKGAIILAAAGNEPTGRPMYPAAYPYVIAVGGADGNGQRWEHSNYGDFIDLLAPCMANMPVGYKGPPGAYAGTSPATAYTAKLVTQYLQKYPHATRKHILKALADAVTDAGEAGPDPLYGVGLLDGNAAHRFLGIE